MANLSVVGQLDLTCCSERVALDKALQIFVIWRQSDGKRDQMRKRAKVIEPGELTGGNDSRKQVADSIVVCGPLNKAIIQSMVQVEQAATECSLTVA